MRQRYLTVPALAAALASAAGCATERAPEWKRHWQPVSRPVGASRVVHVSAAVRPLGSVPYDNLSLPIVSPDGRFLATQTGIPPTWQTVLAEPDAPAPEATAVEIYRIHAGQKSAPTSGPEFVAVLPEPVVMGRACDESGFLVESVRPDGARWIGRAAWADGEIEWLITGEDVNAFAALGPNGLLAWSRRPADGEHFDLVIRDGPDEWTIASQGEDWLMPTWSGRGDGLFVLILEEDRLDAAHVIASNPVSLRQSLRRVPLASTGASVRTAYQTVHAQQITIVAGDARPGRDEFVFFHPARIRAAVWRPRSAGGMAPVLLHQESWTAIMDGSDHALVATQENLIRQSVIDPSDQVPLLDGFLVPRATNAKEAPYILLSPSEETPRVGLTALQLLEVEAQRR